ncbi:beta-glucan synthesis-associated protein-domain-containing protein [Mycena crocata]|nr:beta-glucan synthesis-associated protein-domain-containing protein [Mycena crocata]
MFWQLPGLEPSGPRKYLPPSPSMSNGAPPVGPNAQRRYFPQTQPVTTQLIPNSSASQRTSAGSVDSVQSSNVHANFARGPSTRSSTGTNATNDSPYTVSASAGRHVPSLAPSISDKYSLSPDPAAWGANVSPNHAEEDDYLHNPDPARDRKNDTRGNIFTARGLSNLGCLLVLGLGLVTLFAGYPLISHFTSSPLSFFGGFNVGGINSTGQVPEMAGNFGLIDLDTPKDAYTIQSFNNPADELQLVFSDEFETDGRTFYPGDDPYWEAVDLHYWQTNNLEWYDPSAATTKNGALEITLSKKPSHDLNYEGGLISTWNKFCFTGGLIVSAVTLPGTNNVQGLWPAIWTMGNLGRAGFGASLEGMWPYTYDACDVGTLPNQTTVEGLPVAATINGDEAADGALSYLPGQRLSRCTCPGESHPGPIHSTDGSYVGRAAPEIDIFEAQVSPTAGGHVSQSAQWAPFNNEYKWFNTSDTLSIPDPTRSELNSYLGGAFQQASSVVTQTSQRCYQLLERCFEIFGFEYKPGFADAYITWISDNKVAWTVKQSGFAPDTAVEIGARPVPQEPLYIIANLGLSLNFGKVDFENLVFPSVMRVDYIRVYQPKNAINIGCDPSDFPTKDYINTYIDGTPSPPSSSFYSRLSFSTHLSSLQAYVNPNYTTWKDDFKQPFPKNKLIDQC